jgi:hypothetical protein
MAEFYSPGQLSVIYPFLNRVPKWLLLGGPADANEAQTAIAKWPDIRVIGVELNPDAVDFQLANGWPVGHPLLHAALSDTNDPVHVINPGSTLRHGKVFLLETTEVGAKPEENPSCPGVTWNWLDKIYGPFREAVLWLDIEHSEYKALLGARDVLARGDIILADIEIMGELTGEEVRRVDSLMAQYDFKVVKDWNDSSSCRDRIYVR